MSRIAILVMFGIVLSQFTTPRAFASFDQLSNDVKEKSEAADPGSFALNPLRRSIGSGCDISSVLQSALGGDRDAVSKALVDAEGNLRSVARQLNELASKRAFEKPLAVPTPRLISETARAATDKLKTGDDCLSLIARLADQSASAISAMREGVGGSAALSAIIANNADISQLVLMFYSIVPAKI